jgi:hypothetical protein
MALYCRSCGLSNFRASHLRFRSSDLSRLLLLRMPVRCLTCEERTYTSLKQFLKLRKERGESQEEGHRERRGPL